MVFKWHTLFCGESKKSKKNMFPMSSAECTSTNHTMRNFSDTGIPCDRISSSGEFWVHRYTQRSKCPNTKWRLPHENYLLKVRTEGLLVVGDWTEIKSIWVFTGILWGVLVSLSLSWTSHNNVVLLISVLTSSLSKQTGIVDTKDWNHLLMNLEKVSETGE